MSRGKVGWDSETSNACSNSRRACWRVFDGEVEREEKSGIILKISPSEVTGAIPVGHEWKWIEDESGRGEN
jgi:hypothetical protein